MSNDSVWCWQSGNFDSAIVVIVLSLNVLDALAGSMTLAYLTPHQPMDNKAGEL
jgi:hypothetical protein